LKGKQGKVLQILLFIPTFLNRLKKFSSNQNKFHPMRLLLLMALFAFSCKKNSNGNNAPVAFRETRTISYNNIQVDVVIDKPALNTVDVLVVFHGTVLYDSNILTAANGTLDEFKGILDRTDMMIVSVAYPGENKLLGDNIVQAEAALLWVKNKAGSELGITVNKVFLGGHSQGGYLVTRLNTLHATNGVIANAPGPLNLVYRCQLEENGQIASGSHCTRLRNVYGTTSTNPDAYFQRSLLNFTDGFKSDILFVQGMADGQIQLYSWPIFRQEVESCSNCRSSRFVEIPGGEHTSLFDSDAARAEFNSFINSH
jgi:hypothetical protein